MNPAARMNFLSVTFYYGAATGAFHSSTASALRVRSVRRELRWRCRLAEKAGCSLRSPVRGHIQAGSYITKFVRGLLCARLLRA